ncbi:MAG TPA: hypothetical protein ENG00_01235, partial [Candidatus Aenigmarchaeota archaeon]|nr:hypothetical protein [Candidatus Aenigmarchaeota archaeon]
MLHRYLHSGGVESMQCMKGDIEMPTSLFAVLVFVSFIAGLAILVQAYFVNFGAVLENSEKDLLAVDAAH